MPISCLPDAGLPEPTADGARHAFTPGEFAGAQEGLATGYGPSPVGGCRVTAPEHPPAPVERGGGAAPAAWDPRPEPGAASLHQAVPFRQDPAAIEDVSALHPPDTTHFDTR